MKLDLTVAKKTFEGLLNEYSRLEIPDFQRPYEWDSENWSDLWNDVCENVGNDYLMGGIVLCGGDNGTDFVIDGQQRITTLTLFIAVCRDYLWTDCASEQARSIAREFHQNHIVKGGALAEKKEAYLLLSEVDRNWFEKRIQVCPDAEGVFSPPSLEKISYKLPSSNRQIWKAYKFFHQKLKERHSGQSAFPGTDSKVEDVIKLTRQVAKRTWFVVTHVPDDTQAYTLFEVLNDRGLELSISDLIKNKILSRAAELQKLPKAKEVWAEIVDALDHENIAPFLRYYWMSSNGKKTTENALYPKLKEEIKTMSGSSLVAFLAKLSEEAEFFQEIIGRAQTSAGIQRELGYLNGYGFRIGNTILLAIWASTKNEKVRIAAIRELKNFLVKYAVFANQVTNELEAIMADIAHSIRKDLKTGLEEMTAKFTKKLPDKETIIKGFKGLEPSSTVARTLLVEFEIHLAGTEKTISEAKQVNIEHIFPQSPSSQWRKEFKVESNAEESYISRLGNLTLLHEKLNKQASNRLFKEKKKAYYKKSDITLTKQLLRTSNWNKKSVDARQEQLAELACEIWGID